VAMGRKGEGGEWGMRAGEVAGRNRGRDERHRLAASTGKRAERRRRRVVKREGGRRKRLGLGIFTKTRDSETAQRI
jgi:hypothetical protein